jgi:glycosyltransferase involved in cell wall biosynthesis
MVGSIEYRKGCHNIGQSLDYLPKNYHLCLVGKLPPIIGIPYLKEIIRMNKTRIHYLGYLSTNDYMSIFEMVDIYVSASLYEACQLTPLEALTFEKKVVTSLAGAIPDFLSKEYPFFIKSTKPAEIAKVILKASESEDLLFKQFISYPKSWEEIGKKIADAYLTM